MQAVKACSPFNEPSPLHGVKRQSVTDKQDKSVKEDASAHEAIEAVSGDTQLYGATATDAHPPRPEPQDTPRGQPEQSSAGMVSFGDKKIDLNMMRESYLGDMVAGRFKIVDFIDRGGMGEVYLGLNESVGQRVAVKFLSKKFTSDESIVSRFGNEAKSYARVTHPNAVTLLDYGQHDDGALYIITEFVEGKSLSKTIKEHGVFSAEQVIAIGKQCCDVLTVAHGEGVIHRDLKPDNLMLIPGPRDRFMVKVLDFGIAKISDNDVGPMTETGAIFGTPEFMSPEQARGDSALPQSDIYALGIILYYMLTGRLPFSGKNKFAVLNKHLNDAPPRPSEIAPHVLVPLELEAVILKCLNKEASERYVHAEDLYEALDEVRDQLGPSRTTSVPPSRSQSLLAVSSRPPSQEEDQGEEQVVAQAQQEEQEQEVSAAALPPAVNIQAERRFGSRLSAPLETSPKGPGARLEQEVDMEQEWEEPGVSRRLDADLEREDTYEDEEEWEERAGRRPFSSLLIFLVVLAGLAAAVYYASPLLLERSGGERATDPLTAPQLAVSGEGVSQQELDRILMTGQVLGVLTSAEDSVSAGELELARKNLETAQQWMSGAEMPALALKKKGAIEQDLQSLEGLEERARAHMDRGMCTPLRKTLPLIKAISPARATYWLERADACARAAAAPAAKEPASKEPAEVPVVEPPAPEEPPELEPELTEPTPPLDEEPPAQETTPPDELPNETSGLPPRQLP